jgi:hypothetical protein
MGSLRSRRRASLLVDGSVSFHAVIEPPDEQLPDSDAPADAQQSAASGADTATPAEISWDFDVSAAAAEAGDAEDVSAQTAQQLPEEISWDVDVSSADTTTAGADQAGDTGIDWDLSLEDAGMEKEDSDGHAAAGGAAAEAPGSTSHSGRPAAEPLLAALMDSSDARAR